MARTNTQAVKDILGDNYDCINNPTLTPYITAANLFVSRVNTCATDKGYTLTSAELTEIEKWMAAHFYTINDPLYKARATLSASATFAERSYLDVAKMLDPSGCVNALAEGHRVDMDWLGKPVSEQIDYEDRD